MATKRPGKGEVLRQAIKQDAQGRWAEIRQKSKTKPVTIRINTEDAEALEVYFRTQGITLRQGIKGMINRFIEDKKISPFT